MTACWFSHSSSAHFLRNIDICINSYFFKSTSINTQYSGLWDTLRMMLFTKNQIKWKCIGRIGWNFWYWFILKFSLEQDTKRWMLYLSNAPLTLIDHLDCDTLFFQCTYWANLLNKLLAQIFNVSTACCLVHAACQWQEGITDIFFCQLYSSVTGQQHVLNKSVLQAFEYLLHIQKSRALTLALEQKTACPGQLGRQIVQYGSTFLLVSFTGNAHYFAL